MKKITKKQNNDFVIKACQMLLRIGCKSFKDEHTSHIRFTLETTVGILRISVDTDNLCCYTIYSKFEEVKKAREKVDCNCFSGKYNLHTGGKESNLNSIICEFENFFSVVLPPKNEEKPILITLVDNEDTTGQTRECHRPPTPGEIRFGYGATHYKTFLYKDIRNSKGVVKKWFKCPDDGLNYSTR